MATTTENIQQQSNIGSPFLGDITTARQNGLYTSGESGAQYTGDQLLALNKAFLQQAYDLYNGANLSNNNYGINSDYNTILNNNAKAINAQYTQQRTEALQNMNNANNAQARAQASNLATLRQNLMTSALQGANAGMVNANILSAYLGQQAQNMDVQTQNLQALQNIAEQRRAALASNPQQSLEAANSAAQQIGALQNSEAANRAGIISNSYYGNGSLTPNIANQVTAREYGNISNANLNAQGGNTTTTSKSETK